MLEKIANRLTRRPKLVMAVALVLLAACVIGAVATRINYDILTYLPPDIDSSNGEKLLEEPFKMAATTMLIVEDRRGPRGQQRPLPFGPDRRPDPEGYASR